jgi:hypothetical protein
MHTGRQADRPETSAAALYVLYMYRIRSSSGDAACRKAS